MTTDARPPHRKARPRTSPLELRLYVAALLAAVYTISWRAIAGRSPTTEAAVATTSTERPHVVWLQDLPASTRPALALPAGWQLASEPLGSVVQPSSVVRAPDRRVRRVRTRSS